MNIFRNVAPVLFFQLLAGCVALNANPLESDPAISSLCAKAMDGQLKVDSIGKQSPQVYAHLFECAVQSIAVGYPGGLGVVLSQNQMAQRDTERARIADVLLGKEIDVSYVTSFGGESLLNLTLMSDFLGSWKRKTVTALLNLGVDPGLKNNDGFSSYDIAKVHKPDLAEILGSACPNCTALSANPATQEKNPEKLCGYLKQDKLTVAVVGYQRSAEDYAHLLGCVLSESIVGEIVSEKDVGDADKKRIWLANFLLGMDFDPNYRNAKTGDGLLHSLLMSDLPDDWRLDKLFWLLDKGVDPGLVNNDGITVTDLGKRPNNQSLDVAQIIAQLDKAPH